MSIVPMAAAVLIAAAPTPAEDQAGIKGLLDAYAAAVSRKDRAAFEALLLSRDIPFSYVSPSPSGDDAASWRNYDDFAKGVFDGAPFTQRFRDVSIRQHGALAEVDLVYVNTDARGDHPGWKTMQLIRIAGRWKIASEFFTGLPAGS